MAALCNSAGHYIFALWFLSSFFLLLLSSDTAYQAQGCSVVFHVVKYFFLSFFFFPRLFSAVEDWMSTIWP